MSVVLITVLALTAAPEQAQLRTGVADEQSVAGEVQGKKPHELRQAIRETMRREAMAKDPAVRAEAIRELAGLLTEVRRDTQLALDEQKRLHALLWSRLTRIKRDLEVKIKRNRRAAGGARRRTDDEALVADAAEQELAATLSQQFSFASQLTGGPGAVVVRSGEAFGGGAGTPDYGEELVALIEKTIAPDTWESAGGNGSIFYFYPLKVLVIRQTGEVHGHAGGLLDGLRRAGP